jgi:glycosyltransferase involved in cell wall biosynthesis
MSPIYFDLRGLFSFPVAPRIKPTGIAKTTMEWVSAFRELHGVEFVAPGLPLASKHLLAGHPELAAIGREVHEQTSLTACLASWLQTSLPPSMDRRDWLSRSRRKLAVSLIPRWELKATEDWVQQTARHSQAFVYFVPFSRTMPRTFPANCVPVMNVFDIIPLLFKDVSFGDASGLSKTIQSFANAGGKFTVNSKHARHDLVSMFDVDAARVAVVPLGVSQNHPNTQARISSSENPYFVYVCSDVQRRKNLPLTIRAFRKFLERTQAPHHLKIVGGGTECMTEMIAENAGSYSTQIIGTGRVTDAVLGEFYSNATGGLYPSLYEGFGLPVLEYMRYGIPVVCSSNTSIPEVCGSAALMVDPLDEEALTAAITRVASDELLRQDLRSKGYDRIKQFSWQSSGKALAEALESFLKNHPLSKV